jgi:uncharacterized protein (TIGR04222 family)
MNPLNLSGPEFLQFYALVLAAAFVTAAVLRYFLRWPGGEPQLGIRGFDAYETALLAGNDKTVIHAALAGLVHRGLLEADTVKRRLKATDAQSPKLHPLESEFYRQIKSTGVIEVDDALRMSPTHTMRVMHERLETRGLLMTDTQAAIARFVPLIVALLVPALGVMKVFVGVSRNRPVGYLIIFIIVSVVLAFWLFGRAAYRSRSGDKALASIRRDARALRSAARAPDRLATNDVSMAVALFGLGAVSVGALADLRSALRPPQRTGGSSWGSGCGGGGCGGGGCGGGCGGGGCGGCSG